MHFKLHVTGGLKQSFFQSGLLLRAQLHCETKKFKQKLSYADKLSIPYAAFLGEDEIQQNKVTVKDLTTGQQQTVTAGEAVALVQAGLAARAGGTPIQEPEA